ncbi:MAG: hypothetical protein WDN72_06770 [Alphaproteobacteria bacterium]
MSTGNGITEARIAEETARVKVESYQKPASLGGWAGGSRTLWAISFLFAVFGIGVGILAPLIPALLGVAGASMGAAMAAIPVSAAVFGATGMLTGFAGGLVMGRVSGAAAAVGEEQEKRMKQWMIRQKLTENPNAAIAPDASGPPEPKLSAHDKWRTYFNPRVGLVMTAIGIAGGLLLAAALVATVATAGVAAGGSFLAIGTPQMMTGLTGIAGFMTNTSAIYAYSAGVMGLFGATWFFNAPKITSDVTSFFGDLIGGKLLGREWGPAPAKQHAIRKSEPQAGVDPAAAAVSRNPRPSYQEMLAARDATAAEQALTR